MRDDARFVLGRRGDGGVLDEAPVELLGCCYNNIAMFWITGRVPEGGLGRGGKYYWGMV